MSTAEKPPKLLLLDHTQLPDHDGTFVKNFQEHPQSILLTDSIGSVLERLHPDGHYAIGQDCGIYWRVTDPLERGAESPDWFYVPNVPPTLDGATRRSYVLWQEQVNPLIILEFVSGNGTEERDQTPVDGKFWVYEKMIRPTYYGIYEVNPGRIEMYHLRDGRFERMPMNERGRYPIAGLDVELGIWQGHYQNLTLPWMRWWGVDGNLLPTGQELAMIQANRADREAERATREAERATREAERADREHVLARVEAEKAAREAERADREAEKAASETEKAAREAERADREAEKAASEAEKAAREAERADREAEKAASEAEKAAREAERADREAEKAASEAERAERLVAQMRALGIEPEV